MINIGPCLLSPYGSGTRSDGGLVPAIPIIEVRADVRPEGGNLCGGAQQ